MHGDLTAFQAHEWARQQLAGLTTRDALEARIAIEHKRFWKLRRLGLRKRAPNAVKAQELLLIECRRKLLAMKG